MAGMFGSVLENLVLPLPVIRIHAQLIVISPGRSVEGRFLQIHYLIDLDSSPPRDSSSTSRQIHVVAELEIHRVGNTERKDDIVFLHQGKPAFSPSINGGRKSCLTEYVFDVYHNASKVRRIKKKSAYFGHSYTRQ